MSQSDYIKDIARYGLENDQAKLLDVLEQLIDHSRKTKKVNFALQLQSILKESLRAQKTGVLSSVGSELHKQRLEDRDLGEFILEKITSDYTFDNLVCSENVIDELSFFIEEHKSINLLREFELPVSNKVLFHGPSGCGKTLASYVLAGELHKLMYVVNLGAIVSSRLGETSKNLAKIFRRASAENCVIFIDEFDSLGKVRDYSQDHGEMKRIVNTILQLLDFLPQECIVIAATNQIEMIDEALIRRFDVNIKFELPTATQIRKLVDLTLRNGKFTFDNDKAVSAIIKKSIGISYYSIQKTLITAIKRSVFEASSSKKTVGMINTALWSALIDAEKKALLKPVSPRKKKA
ncbi:MAG: AAA family ATPase [Niastella sp.]|nr:AAA family ATPase [Niastella sp.]PZR02311.1 MAG: AAA family ATPase [Flavobacterium psychrophilum]